MAMLIVRADGSGRVRLPGDLRKLAGIRENDALGLEWDGLRFTLTPIREDEEESEEELALKI
jgi:bifunctional DNA-binding transcriptional regulator/antitoxin component of YhaV-PrlF toxin-antitoxin module